MTDFSKVEETVGRFHRRLCGRTSHPSCWGGTEEILVYSLLTGRRVVCLKNSEDGFEVALDSRAMIEKLSGLESPNSLEEPVWRESQVICIYWHPGGDPFAWNFSKVSCNHFAALMPVEEASVCKTRHCVFHGGATEIEWAIPTLVEKRRSMPEGGRCRKKAKRLAIKKEKATLKEAAMQAAMQAREELKLQREEKEKARKEKAEAAKQARREELKFQKLKQRKEKEEAREQLKLQKLKLREAKEEAKKEKAAAKEAARKEAEAKREEKRAAKVARQQNLQTAEEMMDVDMRVTPQELKTLLGQFKALEVEGKGKNMKFCSDSNRSLVKAVIMFYLNSGCLRFQRWKDHSTQEDGAEVDVENLLREIEEETPSDQDLINLVEAFEQEHSFTESKVFSCGSCGIKEHECGTTRFESVKVRADSLLAPLKFDKAEVEELKRNLEDPFCRVSIPTNKDWSSFKEINVNHAKSFWTHFNDEGEAEHWHLHPELVEKDSRGGHTVRICSRCIKALKKKKVPRLSIKAGVDFGWAERLGLEAPNLPEQLILARNRLYFTVMKVCSNSSGAAQGFDLRSMARINAILFPHDAPEVGGRILERKLFAPGGLLDENKVKEVFQIYFLADKNNFDRLMKKVFGTTRLFARSHVIAQWLLVLKHLNPEYLDIDASEVKQGLMDARVQRINHVLQSEAKVETDPDLVRFQNLLGSDVAHNQSTDGREFHSRTDTGDSEEAADAIRYTYMMDRDSSHLTNQEHDYRVPPLEKFADLNSVEDEKGGGFMSISLDDLEQLCNEGVNNSSVRGTSPINDYENNDSNLTKSFPCVFLTGKAYGKCIPNLNLQDREHLLHQFTQVAAQDRRLIGHLFSTLQRAKIQRSVAAFVDSHSQAVTTMRDLLNNQAEREKLQAAIQFPQLKSSTQLVKKYMDLLKYVGRDVDWGALEGSKMKHRCMGLNSRYSSMTCFFTLSPNNLANPRSVRLACKTISNVEFPAIFHEGCSYGSNGVEFLKHIEVHERHSHSEGVIQLPEAFTKSRIASLAKNNPIAFVTENKKMLYQIVNILIGLTPSGSGYRRSVEGTTCQRSQYYMELGHKGIFGHALTLIGVTEDHQRGHLHWHFTVNAGLTGDLLQKFSKMPEVCAEISKTLDRIYTTEINEEMHTAVAVRSTMNQHKVEWDIEQGIIDSVQARDSMHVASDKSSLLKDLRAGSAHAKLKLKAQEHGNARQFHQCQKTCFNLGWGRFGCRFNFPRPLCNSTHPTILAARIPDGDGICHPNVWWDECSDAPSVTSDELREPGFQDMSMKGIEELTDYTDYSIQDGDFSTATESHLGETLPHFALPSVVTWTSNGTCETSVHMDTIDNISDDQMMGASMESNSPQLMIPSTHQLMGPSIQQIGKSQEVQRPQMIMEEATEDLEKEDGLLYDSYDLRWHPLFKRECQHNHLTNMLQPQKKSHVVNWDTSRKTLQLPHFLEEQSPLELFVPELKHHLKEVPPFDDNHSKFWTWLTDKASEEQLLALKASIKKAYETGNGNVSAFNPLVGLCTASHHNVELLGSLDQARNAMFYLIPYQAKDKFPIGEALPIIKSSKAEADARKSQTVKGDEGTVDRKLKQALARILGKIQMKMEMSDYQVAAALLEMPSMITTDAFCTGSPEGLVSLRTGLQATGDWKAFANDYCRVIEELRSKSLVVGQQKARAAPEEEAMTDCSSIDDGYDSDDTFIAPENGGVRYEGLAKEFQRLQRLEDGTGSTGSADSSSYSSVPKEAKPSPSKWSIESALKSRGPMRKIVLKSQQASEEIHPPVTFVPTTLLYLCRGDALSWLNYYEYLGCIGFANTKSHCPEVTNFRDAQKFPMHPEFEGANDCHHYMRLKQCTPLLTGKTPVHPGLKPSLSADPKKLQAWKRKADAYAKHYLVLFRPETVQDNSFGYSWEDLEAFVKDLQDDTSFISKSRLMIMENHMRGLKVSKVCETMMKNHRSEARHMWTKEEKLKFTVEEMMKKDFKVQSLWDQIQTCGDGLLTERELVEVENQLHYDEQMQEAMQGVMATPQVPPRKHSNLDRTIVSDLTPTDVVAKVSALKAWKDPGRTSASSADPTMTPAQFAQVKVAQLQRRDAEAASQQVEIFKTYSDHFQSVGLDVPKMTLVHGPPGVGKTQVRDALIKMNKICGKKELKTAAFAINCISMQGETTASLIKQKDKVSEVQLGPRFFPEVIAKIKSSGFTIDSVIFVEEVSTQAPWHLSHLSSLCKELTNEFGSSFGGCHVLFFGDFTQLGPVKAGKSIPQAVFEVHAAPDIKKELKKRKLGVSLAKSQSNIGKGCGFCDGVDIFTSLKWFELNIQQRARGDRVHSKFVEGNYYGDNLHLSKIKDHIGLLRSHHMNSIEWATAPALVSTNRIRSSVLHNRALHLAKLSNTVVIRWLSDFQKWKNKPQLDHYYDALQDPCFWEYFVVGCPGHITKNINKSLHLINGQKMTYHSIVMPEEHHAWLQDQIANADPNQPIDLPVPPVAINIKINLTDSMTLEMKQALVAHSIFGSIASGSVVIPITPVRESWPVEREGQSVKRTPVRGGPGFGPSKVQLRPIFPLQPSLAMTVHKAQGETLEKAIILMSQSKTQKWNFTYEHVHVAFSRVTKSENLKLLLVGSNDAEKWKSITYVNDLKQDPTITWYFMGFRQRLRPGQGNPNQNWMSNSWSAQRANTNFRLHLKGYDPYNSQQC